MAETEVLHFAISKRFVSDLNLKFGLHVVWKETVLDKNMHELIQCKPEVILKHFPKLNNTVADKMCI